GTPIHLRALEQPPGAAATHLPVKRPYILQAPPRSDPVLQLPLAQGPHLELKTDARINRALGDGVSLQPTVFGIPPCPFGARKPLGPVGVLKNASILGE